MSEKPRRTYYRQGTASDRSSALVEVLKSRSTSAFNFLQANSNQEQVVFATIAELRAAQLQVKLLETQLLLLQERKRASQQTGSPSPSSSSGEADHEPLPYEIDTVNSSNESEQNQLVCVRLDTECIYRNCFTRSELPQGIVSPTLQFMDCNQAFVDSLPTLVFGPMSRDTFLRQGIRLLDMHRQPEHRAGVMADLRAVCEQGVLHRDNVTDNILGGKVSVDFTLVATFDHRPDGTKVLRYISLYRRGMRIDPSLTVEAVRLAMIGQAEQLPLPRPSLASLPQVVC